MIQFQNGGKLMTKYERVISDVFTLYSDSIDKEDLHNYQNIYFDYRNDDPVMNNLVSLFEFFHKSVNKLLESLNDRILGNKHYLADDSRSLISTIGNIRKLEQNLKGTKYEFNFNTDYAECFAICDNFLQKTMGSEIPHSVTPFTIIEYDPIFIFTDKYIDTTEACAQTEMHMIGSGSYANVFKFDVPLFRFKLAVKILNKNSNDKEKQRFRMEYDFMKLFNSPYILHVYSFQEDNFRYYMELCDFNLDKFMDKYNSSLSFSNRKKLALQFLQGIKQIHGKNLLHRDISYNNVLINCYDDNQYIIKISDFGLCKSEDSVFTSDSSEMKGTIRDPLLSSFKEYNLTNEIYAIGFILNLILTGNKSPKISENSPINKIIGCCISTIEESRYKTLENLISDVNGLRIENK